MSHFGFHHGLTANLEAKSHKVQTDTLPEPGVWSLNFLRFLVFFLIVLLLLFCVQCAGILKRNCRTEKLQASSTFGFNHKCFRAQLQHFSDYPSNGSNLIAFLDLFYKLALLLLLLTLWRDQEKIKYGNHTTKKENGPQHIATAAFCCC